MSWYKLIFHKQVENDLKNLDNTVLIFFQKKLKQLINNPEIWIDLWNKLWLNLSWFKKLYFLWKKYRIVYRFDKWEIIIYVISVWKREDFKVYKEAYKRIKNKAN